MMVKELIAELSKLDQNAEIVVANNNVQILVNNNCTGTCEICKNDEPEVELEDNSITEWLIAIKKPPTDMYSFYEFEDRAL